jgi:hypothetical protein
MSETVIRFARVSASFALVAGLSVGSFVASAAAQAPGAAPLPPRVTRTLELSGPRFGLTLLSAGNVDALKQRGHTVRPVVSQFGWQFERRFYSNADGVTALTEWVPLLSGLEQGEALPSLNWLVGVRTATGREFGIGPNVSPAGVGLVLVGGVTVQSGALNVPLNIALTTSKSGPRVTILTGFNLRRR